MSNQTKPGHVEPTSSHLTPLNAAIQTFSQSIDPYSIWTSQIQAQIAWWQYPQACWRAADEFAADMVALSGHTLRRSLGLPADEVYVPNPADARFADPIWTESAAWDILKEWYLTLSSRMQKLSLEAPGLSEHERHRAAFWQRNTLNMLSPTNFFWLNPQAMAQYAKTDGESVRQGLKNFARDVEANNIQMVEPDAFTVGKDLATTLGKVIFRNRLVELIHYAPTTDQVRQMPILIVTPWINKFYILDLTEKKSLVKYLTDQGFSVFISSWKNPTPEMQDVRFDDYLQEGVSELVRVTTEFCKVPQIHLVGYCIGGTLVATYMAWAHKRFAAAKMPVAHWTLFTSLTDFSQPGEIGVFIDEACLDGLDELMAKKGYLDGNEMAASFRLLRSNSLIWNYWVQSYLLGEKLPPFDVLFWNVDATRMPQAMHSYYLRQMYLHNRLVQPDALTIGGESIDLSRIQQSLYAVTAEEDHIAPWSSCYQIRKVIHPDAAVRFVRSTSGHILGIVNPPVQPPKRAYWVAEPTHTQDAEHWLAGADKKPGSWWDDWTTWLSQRTGEKVPAYATTNRKFPALADAPGSYVMEK
ncbi:PHA/PHB synthase family protein [Rhodoferax fermentans]|uniref:PHA/PHB synthase family protein n=1 Tax=Rhodoferax fermentans TaxID=28066 RepID=UPI000992BD0D|nr:alpha/beta fold hydrolase [Rhodoferax fermentans]MBK1683026.1 alpha/beta hydrolase [Rhodoferax fermentans]